MLYFYYIVTYNGWSYHERSPEPRANNDFKALNKISVKEGIYSSKVIIIFV